MTGPAFERKITLGTIIAVVVNLVGIGVAFGVLKTEQSSQGATIDEIKTTTIPEIRLTANATNAAVGSLQVQMGGVVANQVNGQQRSAQTQSTLADMQKEITQILQQTAAINATLAHSAEPH